MRDTTNILEYFLSCFNVVFFLFQLKRSLCFVAIPVSPCRLLFARLRLSVGPAPPFPFYSFIPIDISVS